MTTKPVDPYADLHHLKGHDLCDLRAAVSANSASAGWLRLGMALPARLLHIPPGDAEHRACHVELELWLGGKAMARIEEMRDGGALELVLDLSGWVTTSDAETLAGVIQERWTVTAAAWAQVLDQAQTHQQMTLLVSRPDAESSDQFRQADRHLLEARTALREGRYREAVTAVRRGVEVLDIAFDIGQARRVQGLSVEDRYGRLARALFDLASASVHEDGVNVGYRWTRSDAMAAVATLMSLMSWSQTRPAQGAVAGSDPGEG